MRQPDAALASKAATAAAKRDRASVQLVCLALLLALSGLLWRIAAVW